MADFFYLLVWEYRRCIMKFFSKRNQVPTCPIMAQLQKRGEYLNIPATCDRPEYRSLRPKIAGIIPTSCCKSGTCLISSDVMGKRFDKHGGPVPHAVIRQRIREYYASRTLRYKMVARIRHLLLSTRRVVLDLIRSIGSTINSFRHKEAPVMIDGKHA
jgi:hypothetical protein